MLKYEMAPSIKVNLCKLDSGVDHSDSVDPDGTRHVSATQTEKIAELRARGTQDEELRLVALQHRDRLLQNSWVRKVPTLARDGVDVGDIQTPSAPKTSLGRSEGNSWGREALAYIVPARSNSGRAGDTHRRDEAHLIRDRIEWAGHVCVTAHAADYP